MYQMQKVIILLTLRLAKLISWCLFHYQTQIVKNKDTKPFLSVYLVLAASEYAKIKTKTPPSQGQENLVNLLLKSQNLDRPKFHPDKMLASLTYDLLNPQPQIITTYAGQMYLAWTMRMTRSQNQSIANSKKNQIDRQKAGMKRAFCGNQEKTIYRPKNGKHWPFSKSN